MLSFTRPTIESDEIEAVLEVLKSGWITSGPKVRAFENALAEFLGGDTRVRMINSGTGALEIALLALDIGPGDEVIVPALSFAASANVILRVGARPVFVDVDLYTRNIDTSLIANVISKKTKAIIPVHFSGLAVDLDNIYELANTHNFVVIEDAAHAIGSQYKGKRIGGFGNPVCFSFHANKNITTIEGGAIASQDEQLIRRIECLRFHGIEKDRHGDVKVTELGGKYNLPDVNAAMGLVQLAKLEKFNRRRKEIANIYFNNLKPHSALVIPSSGEGHSWHMFCVCIDHESLNMTREAVIEYFSNHGVAVGKHYPAIHLFPLYRKFGYGPGDFPQAEKIGKQTISLPLFPAMSDEDAAYVCKVLNDLLES